MASTSAVTLLDFYMWGTVEKKFYAAQVNTNEELLNRTNAVFNDMGGEECADETE